MKGETIIIPEYKKENFLLSPPREISSEELKRRDRRWTPYFFSKDHGYRIEIENGKIGFRLEYVGQLPDELSEEEKSNFIKTKKLINDEEKNIYRYEYGDVKETGHEPSSGFEESYHIASPRVFETGEVEPGKADTEEAAEFIKENKVIFYTGAGISASEGLTMQSFRSGVGSDCLVPADAFIMAMLNNPEGVIGKLKGYVEKAFESPPTPAHKSLARLAREKGAQIMTENFDFLQERAGVDPYRISGPRLKKEIDPEWLRNIEAVVCIGLSYDDRGFLGWYKENNPKGKIISVNLRQPSYLGNEDIFIQGDLQAIVPAIEETVKS
jgi:hypothetical protein